MAQTPSPISAEGETRQSWAPPGDFRLFGSLNVASLPDFYFSRESLQSIIQHNKDLAKHLFYLKIGRWRTRSALKNHCQKYGEHLAVLMKKPETSVLSSSLENWGGVIDKDAAWLIDPVTPAGAKPPVPLAEGLGDFLLRCPVPCVTHADRQACGNLPAAKITCAAPSGNRANPDAPQNTQALFSRIEMPSGHEHDHARRDTGPRRCDSLAGREP